MRLARSKRPARQDLLLLVLLAAATCAKPNKYTPPDPARVDANADSPTAPPIWAGQDAAGVTVDGPIPSQVDPDAGDTDAIGCNAGATRCRGSEPVVEVCTLTGQWTAKETCT
jgi:hypothetical protein